MDLSHYLNTFLALVFVLALMGLIALFAKRLGLSQHAADRKGKRLQVIETLPLDPKRKAVLLARDHKQHLVILGPNGETVIETGIESRGEEVAKIKDDNGLPFD